PCSPSSARASSPSTAASGGSRASSSTRQPAATRGRRSARRRELDPRCAEEARGGRGAARAPARRPSRTPPRPRTHRRGHRARVRRGSGGDLLPARRARTRAGTAGRARGTARPGRRAEPPPPHAPAAAEVPPPEAESAPLPPLDLLPRLPAGAPHVQVSFLLYSRVAERRGVLLNIDGSNTETLHEGERAGDIEVTRI